MSKELELARELVKQLEEAEKTKKVRLSELNPGDVFKIGENDFIVLEHNYDTTTVISKGFMAENVVFDEDTRDYNKSNLKKVIEKCIQPVIESEVGVENLVEYDNSLLSVDNQKEFDPCRAKVMPPNFGLVRRFNNLIVNITGNPWTFEHNNNNEPLRPCDRRSKRKGDFEAGKLPKSGVIGTELVQNYITK